MGGRSSTLLAPRHYAGFDEVRHIAKTRADLPHGVVLLNTMPFMRQQCTIRHTVPAQNEEMVVNGLLDHPHTNIILYGENCYDLESLHAKFQQLSKLGFVNVRIYLGGLFEWMLLHKIYGADEFPLEGTLPSDIMCARFRHT